MQISSWSTLLCFGLVGNHHFFYRNIEFRFSIKPFYNDEFLMTTSRVFEKFQKMCVHALINYSFFKQTTRWLWSINKVFNTFFTNPENPLFQFIFSCFISFLLFLIRLVFFSFCFIQWTILLNYSWTTHFCCGEKYIVLSLFWPNENKWKTTKKLDGRAIHPSVELDCM